MCSKLIWGTCNESEILQGRDNWLSGDDFAQTEHEIVLRNNLVHEGLFVRQIRNVQINRNTIDVTIAFLIYITGASYLILPDCRYWQRLKQIILNGIYPSKIDISRSTGNESFNASNWEGKTHKYCRMECNFTSINIILQYDSLEEKTWSYYRDYVKVAFNVHMHIISYLI